MDLFGILIYLVVTSLLLFSSAIDRRNGQRVAIKKVFKPFSNVTLLKRTYRELLLLKYMKYPNLISLLDVYKSNLEDM